MTFKSIETILREHEKVEQLVKLVPPMDPDESEIRTIWAWPSLHQWIHQPDRSKSQDFKPKIQAHLKHFIIGKRIDNLDFMKDLDRDIFEFRVQFQKRGESTRVFGGFAKIDCFVALDWKPRDQFGDIDDPRWGSQIDRALDRWSGLFSGRSPVRARPFSNCVSCNFDDHYEQE